MESNSYMYWIMLQRMGTFATLYLYLYLILKNENISSPNFKHSAHCTTLRSPLSTSLTSTIHTFIYNKNRYNCISKLKPIHSKPNTGLRFEQRTSNHGTNFNMYFKKMMRPLYQSMSCKSSKYHVTNLNR